MDSEAPVKNRNNTAVLCSNAVFHPGRNRAKEQARTTARRRKEDDKEEEDKKTGITQDCDRSCPQRIAPHTRCLAGIKATHHKKTKQKKHAPQKTSPPSPQPPSTRLPSRREEQARVSKLSETFGTTSGGSTGEP